MNVAPPQNPDESSSNTGSTTSTDSTGSSTADAPDAAPSVDRGIGFEAKRKALHLLALVVPLLMWILGKPVSLALLVPSALLGVGADVWRAYSPRFNDVIRRLFGPLMRGSELPPVGQGVRVNGATCVLVGATLTTWIFPLRIAVPVFAMFMIADAAAALVGRSVGRLHWPGSSRTVEGTAAFIVAGLGVMACFPSHSPLVAGAAVLTAAATEAAPLRVNDNVRVPLAAGAVVALLELWWLGHPVDFFL